MSPLRNRVSMDRLAYAGASTAGLGAGLRSLEIRFGPDTDAFELREQLREVNRGILRAKRDIPAAGELEYGVVLHFRKNRGELADLETPSVAGMCSLANPDHLSQGYRYRRAFLAVRNAASSIIGAFNTYLGARQLICGIDCAADESGVPNWVVAPAFNYVSEAASLIARGDPNRDSYNRPEAAIRRTVHCGEDFVHLATGLRRVSECLRYLGLREGDRLGHAFAAGVDCEAWARDSGPLSIPLEDRVLDLAWEWRRYSAWRLPASPGRLVWIRYTAEQLGQEWFGFPVSMTDLLALLDGLYSQPVLATLGFVSGYRPMRRIPRAQKLVWAYLTDKSVYVRGRRLVDCHPVMDGDAGALTQVQRSLIREIGRRGLIVEVNPTSNVLIENAGDLSHHGLWRLRPPSNEDDGDYVSIAVGSDDPYLFATNIREEYQWLSDALLERGLSVDQAERWLEQVRIRGLDARFAKVRSIDDEAWRAAPVLNLPLPLRMPLFE